MIDAALPLAARARAASRALQTASTATKNAVLERIASSLTSSTIAAQVLAANGLDVEAARAAGLDPALVDRLVLDSGTFDPTFIGTAVDGINFSVINTLYDGTDAGTNAEFDAANGTFIFSTADATLYFDNNGIGDGYTVVATFANNATLAATDLEFADVVFI